MAEGPELFYQGELAPALVADCAARGGLLTMADLRDYRVMQRAPVLTTSHGAEFAFNAPPSPGGSLVAFALALLDPLNLQQHRAGVRRNTAWPSRPPLRRPTACAQG